MSVRSFVVASALMVFALLISSCSFGDLFAPQSTPTPTRTRRPTPTNLPPETDTPTATATPVNTATFTPVPPTATFTQPPPTNTFTPLPPTATFTRRPPTLTFTPAPPPPPTNTPAPAFPLTFKWVDMGRPMTANECTFQNGTRVEGTIRRPDGSLSPVRRRSAAMHLWIKGYNNPPYAYPGDYRDFPTEGDGRWNAEFPKQPVDYEWHIFISAPLSDDPISADLSGVASGRNDGSGGDRCGQPGTKNWFVADWIIN
ncbi:MAG: hypothetical protein ABI874_13370 [Chloroflexota bacterium]